MKNIVQASKAVRFIYVRDKMYLTVKHCVHILYNLEKQYELVSILIFKIDGFQIRLNYRCPGPARATSVLSYARPLTGGYQFVQQVLTAHWSGLLSILVNDEQLAPAKFLQVCSVPVHQVLRGCCVNQSTINICMKMT